MRMLDARMRTSSTKKATAVAQSTSRLASRRRFKVPFASQRRLERVQRPGPSRPALKLQPHENGNSRLCGRARGVHNHAMSCHGVRATRA